MKTLHRKYITIGLIAASLTCANAQNIGMQSMRQANQQARDMHRPNPQPTWGKIVLPRPYTEQVIMPDGHIVEYHHIFNGPLVIDSIPFERKLQAHFIPFAGIRMSDIISGPTISSSPFKPGVNAGFRVDWYKDKEKSIYVATGLHYALTTLAYNNNGERMLIDQHPYNSIFTNNDNYPYSGKVQIHNLFIPLYVGPQFKIGDNNFGFGFGGQFGVIAYSETRERDRIFDPYTEVFDGNLGGELWYTHKNLFVGFQYSWGFQELNYANSKYRSNLHSTTNRQTFSINIGYRIFQKL